MTGQRGLDGKKHEEHDRYPETKGPDLRPRGAARQYLKHKPTEPGGLVQRREAAAPDPESRKRDPRGTAGNGPERNQHEQHGSRLRAPG